MTNKSHFVFNEPQIPKEMISQPHTHAFYPSFTTTSIEHTFLNLHISKRMQFVYIVKLALCCDNIATNEVNLPY